MKILTKETYEESIKDGTCLVAIGASWCPDCRKIEPIMEILTKEYPQVHFFHVPFDKEESLKDTLSIQRIPTIILYKNGVEIGERLVEPNSKDAIEGAIKKAINA